MNCLNLNALSLLSFVWCATALVHYQKMDKGTNGCKPKPEPDAKPDDEIIELKVGGVLKDKNTCGIYVCQNTHGDALIHYCQKPVPFEMCSTDGVATDTPFPECCWKCVGYVSCDSPQLAALPEKVELSPEEPQGRNIRKLVADENPAKRNKKKTNLFKHKH
ncbi:uncharacterized protein LOC6580209 [Drosophila mojavensis]|uniref:Single domain-containing protein n=1 Tax=Drosophila mojavensis TaxID=7230 RepID=B4KNL7_DROMO|nr:uncharacterized protein LOC6580209 [Drosophila mojavensis]EDW10002.1 uncharacterized protein Dmoj_GI20829 [Drosophila mojavensis]